MAVVHIKTFLSSDVIAGIHTDNFFGFQAIDNG